MEKEISDLFKSELTKTEFDEARFEIEYSGADSSSSQGYIILNGNQTNAPAPREVRRKIKSYFDEVKENPIKRFNKVILYISKNGDPSIQYIWSDEQDVQDKLMSAQVFPQWINERMMAFIYEAEFPNGPTEKDGDGDPLYVSTWDRGIFTFTIGNGKIHSDILLYKGEHERHIEVSLPEYFIKAMLEHHEITNTGILKDEWKPWTKLVIDSPHNSLPYSTMDNHVFYSNE
jgi:hypothetical protein